MLTGVTVGPDGVAAPAAPGLPNGPPAPRDEPLAPVVSTATSSPLLGLEVTARTMRRTTTRPAPTRMSRCFIRWFFQSVEDTGRRRCMALRQARAGVVSCSGLVPGHARTRPEHPSCRAAADSQERYQRPLLTEKRHLEKGYAFEVSQRATRVSSLRLVFGR